MQPIFTFDVCTIGAGTRDVFISSKHFELHTDPTAPAGFDACFPMGTKIALDNVILETGGGATNAAVTFRNFGLKTTCICAVGKDDNGKAIINALKSHKVSTKAVQILNDKTTSYSVILLAGSGQRSILVYRGASNDLDPDKTRWKKIISKWIYLTSLGGNLKKNRSVFKHAKNQNSLIAWNPGNDELKLGLKTLNSLLRRTDILLVNREEAAMLANEAPRHLDRIIKKIGKLPKLTLVITDGPNGAYVYEPQYESTFYAEALPGKRVNTTGAGDSFGSAFVAGYLKTKNFETALRAGICNSLGVITHMGAKAGILKSFPPHKDLNRVRIHKM